MTANDWRRTLAVLVGFGGDGVDPPDREAADESGPARSVGTDPSRGADGVDEPSEFRFLGGLLRSGIDNAPLIVIGVTILLFGTAELTPGGVDGVSALLTDYQLIEPIAAISGPTLAAVVVGWSAILLVIFIYGNLIDPGDLSTALLAYGVIVLLILGTAVSVVLVLTSADPTQLPTNVVFTSGYLLMLLATGWYTCRSMAYTEGLINHLGGKLYDPYDDGGPEEGSSSRFPRSPGAHHVAEAERGTSPLEDAPATYRQFVCDLQRDLRKPVGPFEIQVAHLFALVVVLPSAYVWWMGTGPQNLGGPTSSVTAFVTYAANLAFDFVIAVITFKFLVLVKYLHELTTESYPPGEEDGLRLIYDLRHPDECAGLYDLGDFAMRVNLLLLVALVYLVYRLYVQGLRALPPEVVTDLALRGVPYNWIFGYVGPVFIFTAVVSAWLYYSFWQLHEKMVRDRRRLLETWPERVDDRHGHIRPDEPGLEEVRGAPVWPIDNKQLIPLVLANALPAVFVVFEVLG